MDSVPRDFSLNIVQGKTTIRIQEREKSYGMPFRCVRLNRFCNSKSETVTSCGGTQLVRQRLGQGAFRILVTDTYERRCAITREKALPALEAAHIQPVTQEGKHRIDNGLLFDPTFTVSSTPVTLL